MYKYICKVCVCMNDMIAIIVENLFENLAKIQEETRMGRMQY